MGKEVLALAGMTRQAGSEHNEMQRSRHGSWWSCLWYCTLLYEVPTLYSTE
jgi:hypothetical protein